MSFSQEFKQQVASINEDTFEKAAIELFRYQVENTQVYHDFVKHLGRDVGAVKSLEEIPFLPISFFKTHKIVTNTFEKETIFESSGTTGENVSKHYVKDQQFYLDNAKRIFEGFYGPIDDYVIFALLPSYLERTGSSLVLMADYFIKLSKNELSGFYLNEYDSLKENLETAQKSGKKVLLLGVTFGLLDFVESKNVDLSNVIVMETGGMKGQRKELTRAEVHQILKEQGNAKQIHSEYGMTELLSQAYSLDNGVFDMPNTMKAFIRDVSDPLTINNALAGGLNVIDLANVDSCAFIETQDMARYVNDKQIEILGRIDNSDIRGCNLLVE